MSWDLLLFIAVVLLVAPAFLILELDLEPKSPKARRIVAVYAYGVTALATVSLIILLGFIR